jgi:hypothetical protein
MWEHNMFLIFKCSQGKFLFEDSCFKGIMHAFMILTRLYRILGILFARSLQ